MGYITKFSWRDYPYEQTIANYKWKQTYIDEAIEHEHIGENTIGFNGIATGCILNTGVYNRGSCSFWWTNPKYHSNTPKSLKVFSIGFCSIEYQEADEIDPEFGSCIRCIKNNMKKTKAFIYSSLGLIFFISFLHNPFYCQNQKISLFLTNGKNDSLITNSSQSRYSGCWGFSQNNQEYAVIGSTEGTHVFRISENNALTSCGYVKGKFSDPSVIHREYKTYRNYLYAVCDEGYSSLQIIDLSYLPDSIHLINDMGAPLFGKTHNIFIDTTEAKMYLCKVSPVLDSTILSPVPMRVFSLSDPTNPTLLWEGPTDIAEVHDIYVKENEAILNCGFDGIRSYNFSNTSNPYFYQSIDFYQDQGYNHQGWLSPNKSDYFYR